MDIDVLFHLEIKETFIIKEKGNVVVMVYVTNSLIKLLLANSKNPNPKANFANSSAKWPAHQHSNFFLDEHQHFKIDKLILFSFYFLGLYATKKKIKMPKLVGRSL